jgi:starch synthase (maltosyl-transferring)
MSTSNSWRSGPRIYNLFPLLAGPFPRWQPHLERARRMEFDWVFLNPFHQAGYSGSLYSVADYYQFDPRLIDPAGPEPEAQFRQMVEAANALGLRVIMDLVINHTAFDSPLLSQHPSWYKRGPDGKPIHPSAKEGDRIVTWGDLIEVDNAKDRDGLWSYWANLAEHYAAMGVTGFRCDAAYKLPSELWRTLIAGLKRAHPQALFFAESLGCPFAETVRLARCGFDFIFNSSKWWDFVAPWCLEQYRQTASLVPSISFPESHDTERLAAELKGDREAVKMRYAFAAVFSTGVMMPIGFELGFKRRLNVVKTRPEDWEQPSWDISDYVGQVNRLKASRRVFNEEGPIDAVALDNSRIVALVKWSRDRRERALLLINKDARSHQSFRLQALGTFLNAAAKVEDLSPDGNLEHSQDFQTARIKPSGFHVIWAESASATSG